MQHTFSPTPPTFNKGFLLSNINWTQNTEAGSVVPVDIISVHLDFSRHRVREEQIAEMSQALSNRNNPAVILGDFNSEWFAEESVIKRLAESNTLSVYKPHADDLHTYNSGYRYDWILISKDLEFVSYKVLPDIISDHLAVLAEIKLKDTEAIKSVKKGNPDR
jgi:endonuclease/exonuclease/phosphatase family metal-dependent hydrolase